MDGLRARLGSTAQIPESPLCRSLRGERGGVTPLGSLLCRQGVELVHRLFPSLAPCSFSHMHPWPRGRGGYTVRGFLSWRSYRGFLS